ncbi:MAG: NADase-type glycan-binding domain-containing protein [Prosthecobacter sp.]
MKSLLLLSLACALSVGNARANGGGYASIRTAGAFQPIGIDQVEMLSEHLEIDLHIEHAVITVEYLLHNPGKKVKVEAGFPVSESNPFHDPRRPAAGDPKTRLDTAVAEYFEGFEATLDGTPLAFELVPDKLDLKEIGPTTMGQTVKGWYKVKFSFDAGQARKLRVSYRQKFLSSLSYLFSAAGMWSGPIRDGVVMVRPVSRPKADIAFNHPKRFTWKENHWEWSFHDFEPTLEDDLEIQDLAEAKRVDFDSRNYGEAHALAKNGLDGVYVAYGAEWVNDRFRAKSWEMHHSSYKVSASSVLPEEKGLNYKAENLRYRDTAHAWVEGAPGDGLGEWLLIKPDKPAHVRQVGIVNGYAKSNKLYEANGRVSALDVSVNEGKAFRVLIPDEHLSSRMFYFDLPATKQAVKTIKLTVAGVHPGKQFHDTAISRIVLVEALEKGPKIIPMR